MKPFCLVGFLLAACATSLAAAEFTWTDINPRGDGPDGKGNSADDTWRFWFELAHRPNHFHPLDTFSSAIPKKGITRKVRGPIANLLPSPDFLKVRGKVLEKAGQLQAALEAYREAEQLCHQTGLTEKVPHIVDQRAGILEMQGDLDGALGLYREAQRLYRQAGFVEGLKQNLYSQATLLKELDQNGAEIALMELRQICQQTSNPLCEPLALLGETMLAFGRQDWDRTISLSQNAERICRELGHLQRPMAYSQKSPPRSKQD